MFLRDLSNSRKLAFYALARQFVSIDGRLAKEEQDLLAMFCSEMVIPVDTPLPHSDIEKLAAAFDTHRARVAILLELLSLGHVDGAYDGREKGLTTKLIACFGMTDEQLEQLEDWVERQIDLMNEAAQLMAE